MPMQGRTRSRQTVLPALYRSAMRMTGRHGMRTLSRFNARLFPEGQVIRLETGGNFFVPPDPHFFGYIVEHERHITRLIAEMVEEGDLCVDAGANIGYFSMMMAARCGRSGRVVAYEPEPANLAMLAENEAIARQLGLALTVRGVAVSDRGGMVELVRGEESTLHRVRDAVEGTSGDAVPCVALADDLRTLGLSGPIKLLKIDVEGHEAAALRGCLDLFGSGLIHAAVVEVTPGEPAREIAAILDRLDVSATCWIDGAWRPLAVPEIPHRTDILLRS